MENYKNIDSQLKDLKAENAHLKKESELKTGWISLISHDFKGAFSTFLSLIEAWEQKSISNTDFFKLLPEVKHDLQKNLRTITDTGVWSRTQTDRFKPEISEIYGAELFIQLKQEFGKKLREKNIQLIFRGDETEKIRADRQLISFTLKKLIDNAIKYSHPNSDIYFEVNKTETGTTIQIEDQGVGMDQKQLKTLFTFDAPVFQGTKGETGSGLSLKIVKYFVDLMNGTLNISTEKNEGCIVSIFLRNN